MAPSNEENSRPTKVDDSFHISEQIKDSGDEVTIVKSGDKTISSSSSEDNVIKDSERAGFQWEYEQFLAKFTFFLDLGWKAVGLFYAVLGGILAIYFTKEVKEPSVVKFLLYAPFYMSIILSLIFFGCGILWWRLISKVDPIAKVKLKMTTTPNFKILTSLFFVFTFALGFTAWGLWWLIEQLV
jgi:hypothetical protein